jgi:thiol:disulfide interchange protein DsbD
MLVDFFWNIEQFITSYSFWGIPASFLGGMLVAVSPCVLPILPITLSIIGEAAINSRIRTVLLSIIFVLGVTITYVTLGVVAAFFGIFLGNIIDGLVIYLILGIICIILGIAFFDIFHIPIFSTNYKPGVNLISVFVLGILCGFSMIPCAFPVLGSILSMISLKQNIMYAVTCLFSFSLGYGIILILVGSSATLMKKLSERKHWFIMIKKVLGVIMIIVGVYFLLNYFKIV